MTKIRSFVFTVTIAALMLFAAGVCCTVEAQDSLKDTTKLAPAMKMAGDSAKAAAAKGKDAVVEKAAAVTEEIKDSAAAATPAEKPAEKVQEKAVNPDAPYEYVTFAEGEKPRVTMETSMGTMEIELWPDVAYKHCQSFVHLIKTGFYDSLTFHRIVPGFVIQGGDPLGNGTGGPGYNVPAEFSNLPHEDGILSMARSNDPNSAGSQFFVCLGRLQSLDNKYTVFGKVISGVDVAHSIEKVPVSSERPKTPVYMTKVTVAEAAPAAGGTE